MGDLAGAGPRLVRAGLVPRARDSQARAGGLSLPAPCLPAGVELHSLAGWSGRVQPRLSSRTPPFNGDWPSSVFASQDPVAIDSVCYDFLWLEWADLPRMSGTEDYLTEAALADRPPSGTVYDPEQDGRRLASLGVHEHWNNPLDKKYTRNLGTGAGIELTHPVEADFDGDSHVRPADLAALSGQWLRKSAHLAADISSPQSDGVVDLKDFAAFARHWTLRPAPAADANGPTARAFAGSADPAF
jgi:hypothetical protein